MLFRSNKQIDGMKYLTSSDKTQLKKSVSASKDVKTVNGVVSEAKALDAKRQKEANDPKKKLEETKKSGTKAVNNMKGLSESGKDYYTGLIKEAKTELDVSKAVAQAEVDSKPYVGKDDKRSLRGQIEEAKTQAEIDRVVKTANNINEDNKDGMTDPAFIKAQKEAADRVQRNYKAGKIDALLAGGYQGLIEGATTIEEINDIMAQFSKEPGVIK